jgi:hypothetical protein
MLHRRALRLALVALPFLAGAAAVRLLPGDAGLVSEAQAKTTRDSPYSYEQTWNTAVRLVRVDLGYKIVEKDEKSGYVLFEYEDKGVKGSGSLELFKGEKAVRVICQLPKFPSYHEIVILDRLEKKLREEYGPPPEKPKPAPDGGADGDPDGGDAS